MKKKLLYILLFVIVAIQFIRPDQNRSDAIGANDISTVYKMPPAVSEIFKKACNDCHTNNTRYPWYSQIQPVGWWLAEHVDDGKREMNLSEFASYTRKDQDHFFEGIIETVRDNQMPLNSYTWMHKDAILTEAEKELIYQWAEDARGKVYQ